jgi:hypothetical protein
MKVILSVPNEGYFECTWWRLFWGYPMKVILSVPDEGYFECTQWRLFWVYLMKVILSVPNEGYFECYLMKVILSVTWWRLFWASPDEGYSRNASCALNLISTLFSFFNLFFYNFSYFLSLNIRCNLYSARNLWEMLDKHRISYLFINLAKTNFKFKENV